MEPPVSFSLDPPDEMPGVTVNWIATITATPDRYLEFIGVGVPPLVGLLRGTDDGVAQRPGLAVSPAAAGAGMTAAELPEQLRDGDGDQPENDGAGVAGALPDGRPQRGRCR